MTNSACRTALVALLAWPTAALASTTPAPAWQRAWALVGVTCPSCSASDVTALKAKLGTRVELLPGHIRNPFYEDCPEGADYQDIKPRPATTARDYLGNGRLPTLHSPVPLAGRLRCAQSSGPANTIGRIVIDQDRAYLLDESGAILTLK